MKLLEEFTSLVRAQKLEQYGDLLAAHTKEAIALSPNAMSDDSIPLGMSKLGGQPHVPSDFEWPGYKDEPLSFIAQINLSQLPLFAERERLPGGGLLSFFYNDSVWGFDPKDRGGFRVYHFDGDVGNLIRVAPPSIPPKKVLFGLLTHERKVREFKACALDCAPMLTLPDDFDTVGLPEELSDPYYELLESLGGHHRLLGHSEPIQGEMELECELVNNGFYCGDSRAFRDARAKELENVCHHWRLLLQVDSETENSDMMWGDAGRLYYWIKEEDLSQGRFEECWLISQCF